MNKRMVAAVGLFLSFYGCAPDETHNPTLASVGAGAVVLYGDSRVAQAPFTHLCDRPVFNAGVSGATTVQMAQRIKWDELRQYPPFAVIVSVGVNDTLIGQETHAEVVVGALRQVVEDLDAIEIPVVLTTIAPVELFDRGLWVHETTLDAINQQLRHWGHQTHHTVLDVTDLTEKGFTTDGIHYTQAFYATLHQWYATHVCA